MRLAAAFAAAVFLPAETQSASVDVNPVRIDLAGPEQPAELRLTNTGNTELSVQVDTLKWDQDLNGADQYLDTEELLAVPPLFTIPPGEQQVVRIGYLGQPSPDLEQSFRLLVTELAAPRTADSQSSGLAFRMRFSIPAFVAPARFPARAELALVEVGENEDSIFLTLENSGNAHTQVASVEVRSLGGWQPLPESLTIRYLLPGTRATILIPPEFESPNAVRISAIDGRDWEYAVRSPF